MIPAPAGAGRNIRNAVGAERKYADLGYTKPLVNGSGEAITSWQEEVTEEYLSEKAITISEKDALALIDKGGYSDELFGPNDTITREQMATILYRYAQYKGYDTTAKADLSNYTDAAPVGSWAAEAIRWSNAEGLVNGTSATTLTPKGSATRVQVAVILTRFCQNIAK